jgi:hypothetical protein
MTDEPIVYRYQESKAQPILGMEPKSLTQAEYDALTPSQRGIVVRSGFWTRAEPGGGEVETNVPNLSAMKRDELNTYAAEQGVDNPESLPTKDAVIEAIQALDADGGNE